VFFQKRQKGVVNMKVKAKTLSGLFKALGYTSFAKKNTEDVEELNTVKIICRDNNMQIISVNSRISAACKIPNVDGTFAVQADNKVLPSCIEAAADNKGEVELKYDHQKHMLFVVGNATVPVPNATGKQGKFEIVAGKPIVSALADDVIKAAGAALISIGKESDVLKSINMSFDVKGQTFKMSSFNGTMMCSANVPLEDINTNSSIKNVLVDGEEIKAILPLLKFVKSQMLDITIADGKIMFSTENVKICMSCRNDEFVNIDKLLGSDFSSYVTFNTKELKKQINAIYKVVKSDIVFKSDGSTSFFMKDDFSMPGNFIRANRIEFDIPIYSLKNIVENITGETITISVANQVLIKIMSEDFDDVVYVTGGVKK